MNTRSYAHVLQFLVNTPLACTESHAALVVAALRGELSIETLITAEGIVLESPELSALAKQGRLQADERRARQREQDRIFRMQDGAAIIPVRGSLVKTWGIEPMSGRTGYDGIKAKLYAALEDDDVKGIFMPIESPGGVVSGMFDLADTIHAANERNGGKPIWAIADEVAASAAFLIGSSADKLFTTRTGVVGSVGILAIYMNQKKALEKEGVEVRVFRGGDQKARMNPFEDLDDETADRFQAEIDMLRDMFVSTVARNLRLSKKAVAETEGRTYIGEEARALGFVSAVASFDQTWMKFSRYINR